jgi:hypothetical protein
MSVKFGPDLVYFIHAKDTEYVKIGTTDNVERRLRAIKTSSPFELNLIGVIRGGRELEKQIHGIFQHLRIRGEWFYLRDDLIEFVNAKARKLSHEMCDFCWESLEARKFIKS